MDNEAKERIVVMGGSFNPPSIAHLKLMQAAIDQLSTLLNSNVRGVFVPSSEAYVKRKMGKLSDELDHTVLPEKLRCEMLSSFQEYDSRLSVEDRELGTTAVKGHTVETLQAIQRENPDAELFFIFGGDKLEGLPRWPQYPDMVSYFKMIIFGRNETDPLQIIRSVPELKEHEDRFVVLESPYGLDSISSTAIREMLKHNQPINDMLTPGVYTMLLAHVKRRVNTILCFEGSNRYLSNFYVHDVVWKGQTYPSSEHAFQAAKCKSDKDRLQFTSRSLSPSEAKRAGRHVDLRSDWEEVKTSVMKEIVRNKFFQSDELARKLMSTGDAMLIEGNTWGDETWGLNLLKDKGENRLGLILMEVRDELNAVTQKESGSKASLQNVKQENNIRVHHMKLYPEPFYKICTGRKTVELRLNDEKRRALCIGDVIVFSCTENEKETVSVRIVELITCASFEDIYKLLHKQELGYGKSQQASPQDMKLYYSEEQEREYGVLGIRFVVITEQTRWLRMEQQYSNHVLFPAHAQEVEANFALNIPIGIDQYKEEIVCDFEKTGCTWIQGDAGTGKTTFVRDVISGISSRYGSAFDFYVFDSNNDYPGFEDRLSLQTYTSMNISSDFYAVYNSLKQLVTERWTYLDEVDKKTAAVFAKVSWKDYLWNRAFFIFDQFDPSVLSNSNTLSSENLHQFREMIGTLHRFGERLGIHIIVSASRPSGSRLEDEMRCESRLRILLRTARPEYYDIYDPWIETDGPQAKTLRPGEFLFYRYPHQINAGKGSFERRV